MFEIVMRKISMPARDQMEGERYRTFGPLVMENYRKLYFNYHQTPNLISVSIYIRKHQVCVKADTRLDESHY